MLVDFTEYVLPNGRRKAQQLELPDEYADKINRVLTRGLKFEVETLRTGHVSTTIADHEEEIDVAIKVRRPNNPEEFKQQVLDMIDEYLQHHP